MMTFLTALLLSVLSGIICGALVGAVRSARKQDYVRGSILAWTLCGGLGAAAIFGATVVFDAIFYFLTGPESAASVFGFTVTAVVLLALVLLLP